MKHFVQLHLVDKIDEIELTILRLTRAADFILGGLLDSYIDHLHQR